MRSIDAFVLHHVKKAHRDQPITGSRIAAMASLESGLTIRHRDVAEVVHRLVTEQDQPIISSPRGCWMAKSDKELAEAILYIKSKFKAHHERVQSLESIKSKMVADRTGRMQMGLF